MVIRQHARVRFEGFGGCRAFLGCRDFGGLSMPGGFAECFTAKTASGTLQKMYSESFAVQPQL